MRLLHPITAKDASEPVRVIVVVRDRSDRTQMSSGGLARSYLDWVCDGSVRTVMVYDSALPELGRGSIEEALAMIAAGGADLAICTDLTRISRDNDVACWFLNSCAVHGVRVIVFEDGLDTADDNWREQIARILDDHDSPQGGEA